MLENKQNQFKDSIVAKDLETMKMKKHNLRVEHDKLVAEREKINKEIQNCWQDYFNLDQEIMEKESEAKE